MEIHFAYSLRLGLVGCKKMEMGSWEPFKNNPRLHVTTTIFRTHNQYSLLKVSTGFTPKEVSIK